MRELQFGEILTKLMDEKDITIKQLAEYLDCTTQAISNYRLGKTTPNYETLIKLADYFGVSCDYLLKGVEPQDKREHQELNLSGAAIKKIKECDREILTLIDIILSDDEFYISLITGTLFANFQGKHLLDFFKSQNIDFFNTIKHENNISPMNKRRMKKYENEYEDLIDNVIKTSCKAMLEYFYNFFKENTAIKETLNKFYGEPKSWDELIIIPPKSSHPAPSDAQP